jgi:two-component system OmpR family response regulator
LPKALIISADEGTRYLYEVAISYQKFAVTVADTISEGVKSVGEHKPDIIILDVMVSDFNDIGLLKNLKDELGSMPLVIMADMKHSSSKKEASIFGAVKYMVKGESSLGELIKTVRKAVKR